MHIGANRFVYAMVRSLVGAMMEYARGSMTKEDIIHLLNVPQRNPNIKRAPVAEPQGLVLEQVKYPEQYGIRL